MAIKDNIKKFRTDKNLSQPALAKLCGWDSQSRISNYETGLREPSISDLIAISNALNISLSTLISGEKIELNTLRQNLAKYELEPAREITGTIPLISWVQAGDFKECFEDLENCEKIKTDAIIKPRTFALRVCNDSMTSSGNISFPEGIIIIVEPDLVAINGDFVVARNGENEATFKQLVKDGNDWYLKPLNTRYKIKLADDVDIIGVVIQAVIKLK